MHSRLSASCVSSLAVTVRSKDTSPLSPYQLIRADLEASRSSIIWCSQVHQSVLGIPPQLITSFLSCSSVLDKSDGGCAASCVPRAHGCVTNQLLHHCNTISCVTMCRAAHTNMDLGGVELSECATVSVFRVGSLQIHVSECCVQLNQTLKSSPIPSSEPQEAVLTHKHVRRCIIVYVSC